MLIPLSLSNAAIQATAFVAGASVMIVELVGIRLFAPALGTSVIVWTCMIGIVMTSLSIGYFVGGNIASKKTTIHTLAYIVVLAGVLLLITTLIQESVLMLISRTMLLTKASIVSSIILFGPVNVIFGMVSPIAVQLYFNTNKHAGASAGIIYAVSTLGSIAGTFSAGLFLIPAVGLFELLIILTCVLILNGAALLLFNTPKAKAYVFPVALLICGLLWTQREVIKAHAENGYHETIISDTNTLYNRITIWETQYAGDPIRVFMDWQSTMYTDPDRLHELPIAYTRYYRLAEHFMPGFKKTLALGGAGYTFPKYFQYKYPDKHIDVVEIDPGMLPLAIEHFGFASGPNFTNITADARMYLNTTSKKYDAIYADAFSKDTVVPFHLTTKEALQEMHDVLTDNGVLIMNIIAGTEGKTSAFFEMQYHTMKSVFPQVYAFEVYKGEPAQNIIMVASKKKKPVALSSENYVMQSFLRTRYTKPIPKNIILTDNYAPVEHALLPVIACLRDGKAKCT